MTTMSHTACMFGLSSLACFRVVGALATAALLATSCSSQSREVVLSASPGSGEAELTIIVDGERTTETISERWEQSVRVSGNFSLKVTA